MMHSTLPSKAVGTERWLRKGRSWPEHAIGIQCARAAGCRPLHRAFREKQAAAMNENEFGRMIGVLEELRDGQKLQLARQQEALALQREQFALVQKQFER